MSFAKLALTFAAAHLAAALLFVLNRAPGTAAALGGLPLDDAWIHLVYARSLAALQWFAYNPGQLETGSTSPLWAMLLVPASWVARLFSVSVVLPAKLTGISTGLLASLGAAYLARQLRLGLAVELTAGLAIALDPALAFAQVSGMEVMLAAAVALWALGELAAEHPMLAGLAAGLAPLARPELILLSVAVLVLVEWRLHRQGASTWLRVQPVLPLVLCVGGFALYHTIASGYPLPSTFYAKYSSRPDQISHNLVAVLGQVLPAWPWFTYGAGFLLWGVGGVVLFRRGPVGILTALFPLAYLLAVSASQYFSQILPFYWQRYLLPPLPSILVAVAAGGVALAGWAWRRRRLAWGPLSMVAAAVVVSVSLAGLPSGLAKSAERYAWNCQNIEELDVAMARWLPAHTAPTEVIAVVDAGAARYFGNRTIFDMMGLNNHRFLHRAPQALAAVSRIDVVISFPGLVTFVQGSPDWQPVHKVATEHLTICDCPQSELVAYRRRR